MKVILNGKNILVTGGTGSIGSEIVRQSLYYGAAKVIVFSRDEIKHFMMRKAIPDNRLVTMIGDIRDVTSIEQVFRRFRVDFIFHAAAMKHVVLCEESPIEAVRTNVMGSHNVIDLAIKYKVPKTITISTDKAAQPINVLGASKFIAECITLNANKYCENGQVFSCVRFGNVAISRGSVIPVFIDDLLHHKPLVVTDLDVTRFIIEIPDAVNLVMKALKLAKGGEIFILKMKSFVLRDLVDVMINRISKHLGISEGEIAVQITGLIQGEKLHEDLLSDNELSHVQELDDMYVISRNTINQSKGKSKGNREKKLEIQRYNSSETKRLTQDELETIIEKYLKTERYIIG